MPFPEEQLDSPAGYFPAKIGQQLQDGKWMVVRKLGWGSRSSTWLAVNDAGDDYMALKIFTTSATQDLSALNEQKFLGLGRNMSSNVPQLVEHFHEQSPRGEHLCLALHALTTSVETMRRSNTDEGEYLPLHIVQKIIPDVLPVLDELARKGIIHGAVLPDNFLFWSLQTAEDIRPEIAKDPCYDMVEVAGSDGQTYLTLKSQPMPQECKWNNICEDFEDADIYLSNFSYARYVAEPAPFKAPPNFLPPEALLGEKAYLLATGTPLFDDSYVASPVKVLNETLPELQNRLRQNGKWKGRNEGYSSVFHISSGVSRQRSHKEGYCPGTVGQ